MLISSLLKVTLLFILVSIPLYADRAKVNALYIPLADHYAALVAYERYASSMKYADFKIIQMKNWDLLRAYFKTDEADMAYVMTPLAISMFNESPNFRWIGLMHRDGNALAVNELLADKLTLAENPINRKPNNQLVKILQTIHTSNNKPIQIGLPHLLSTHAVILYRYLKDNNATMTLSPNYKADVLVISIAPPKSPTFIKIKNRKSTPAALEQSLPWSNIVETDNYGKIVWYSKDIIPSEYGHVECISIAKDKAIKEKFKAIKEVQYYLHKAGDDIEKARRTGGKALDEIILSIRKHIPQHTTKAIKNSLQSDLNAINYKHLNVDKKGFKLIMDYAIEGKILKKGLNIEHFADERFNIELEEQIK